MIFHQIFIEIATAPIQFPMDSFETMYSYCLGQSSNLLLFSFVKFAFFIFYEFSSDFH